MRKTRAEGILLFVGAGAFAVGVLCETIVRIPWPLIVVAVFVFALCLLGLLFIGRSITWKVLAVSSCLFLLGVGRVSVTPQTLPSAFASLLNQKIAFSGEIIADPDIRAKNQQLVISTTRADSASDARTTATTHVLIFAPLSQQFSYGEHVRIVGKLAAPEPFETDDGREFRYDNYLAKKSIFSTVQNAEVTIRSGSTSTFDDAIAFLYSLKHTFVHGLSRALPHPYDELAVGLLTGNQHGLDEDTENALEFSGLVWVFVLAGYHVTLIAEGILVASAFLPRAWRYALASTGVLVVVFVTGASAPSLRGGIMALGALYAQATGRTYDSLRMLAATLVLILLYNPLLLAYDSGFQLSLVITPALILGVPIIEKRLVWIHSKLARETIVVSTVAQIACFPLLLWQTGQLDTWSIPANLFVMPLVPISMFAAVSAGVAGAVFPAIAALVGLPAYALLAYILTIAKTAALLPFATATIPPFSFWLVLPMYAALLLLLIRFKQEPKIAPEEFGVSIKIRRLVEQYYLIPEGDKITKSNARLTLGPTIEITRRSLKHIVESRIHDGYSAEGILSMLEQVKPTLEKPDFVSQNKNQSHQNSFIAGRFLPNKKLGLIVVYLQIYSRKQIISAYHRKEKAFMRLVQQTRSARGWRGGSSL